MAYRNRVKEESPDVTSAASPIKSSHESPMRGEYWQEHESILTERMIGKERASMVSESLKINKDMMIGADRRIILQLMSLLENVDEEDHERTLEALIDDYDVPNTDYELLDSIECDEELEDVDSDKKPAAQVRPIKHTHTRATSATSINLDPVITGVGMIGREECRTISRRRITQEIPGRKIITHRDVIFRTHVPKVIGHRNIFTTDIMDSSKVPPSGGGSVPFSSG